MFIEQKIVVTRHHVLVQHLLDIGLIQSDNFIHIEHVGDPKELLGKKVIGVIGVLPHSLSSLCKTYTEVPLLLTPNDRSKELTLARLREVAQPPQTYVVEKIHPSY
jgi:hypothetical protein